MDKRFLLTLVLAALVLVVGQMLFPGPKNPANAPLTASGTSPESTQVNAPPAPGTTSTVVAAPARAESLSARAPRVATAPARADTVPLVTSLASYRFSTVGAAPISASMHEYRALSAEDGKVELARHGVPLVHYQLHLGADTIPLDQLVFTIDSGAATVPGKPSLTFRTQVKGTTVTITYAVAPDTYLLNVSGQVQGAGAQRGELLVTLPHGLRSNEADSADDQRNLALVTKPVNDGVESFSFSKLAKLDSNETHAQNGPLAWVASKSKYFLVALIAGQHPFSGAVLSPFGAPRTTTSQSAVVFVPVQSTGHFVFQIYAGPQEWHRLVALGQDFTQINKYGSIFSPIIQPFTVIIMQVLLWMHSHLLIAYGWVVVIFGVGLRLLMWPLNQKAMRTSLRMQRLQPELQALQKKYKNSPEKQHAEMMRLYKEHNMSPFSPL